MPEINTPETIGRSIDPNDLIIAARVVSGQPTLIAADPASAFAQRYRYEAEVMLALWGMSGDVVGGEVNAPTATWVDTGWDGVENGPWYGSIDEIPADSTGTLYVAQGRAVKSGGVWHQTPWGTSSIVRLPSGFCEFSAGRNGESPAGDFVSGTHTHYRVRLGDGTWSPWEKIVSTVHDRGWVTLADDRDAYPTGRIQGKNFSCVYTDLGRYETLRVITKIYDGYDSDGVRGDILGTVHADFPVSQIEPLNRSTTGYRAGRTLRAYMDAETGGSLTHSRADTANAGVLGSRAAFRMHLERPQGYSQGDVIDRFVLKRISWAGEIDHFSLSMLIR